MKNYLIKLYTTAFFVVVLCTVIFIACDGNDCNHVYTEELIAATCTDEGYTLHTCTICGKMYADNDVPALNHVYTEELITATCTDEGYTLHTCTGCGKTYKDNLRAAFGHDYQERKVAPTCITYSKTEHICIRCGNIYIDNEGNTYAAHSGVGKCSICNLDYLTDMKDLVRRKGALEDGEFVMSYQLPTSDYTYVLNCAYNVADEALNWRLWIYSGATPSGLFSIAIDKIDRQYIYSLVYDFGDLTAAVAGIFNAANLYLLSKLTILTSNLNGTAYQSLNDNLASLSCSLAKATVSGINFFLTAQGKNYSAENFGFVV